MYITGEVTQVFTYGVVCCDDMDILHIVQYD